MAQKAIREFFAKNLVTQNLSRYLKNYSVEYMGFSVSDGNVDSIKFPKFNTYVAKPDELFGKRGKNNLIFIDKDPQKVKAWIKSKMQKPVKVIRSNEDKGIIGNLRNFIVEPMIEHSDEYYLAMKTERDADVILFSSEGGIEVEENWDKVTEIKIPFKLEATDITANLKQLNKLITNKRDLEKLIEFINALYQVFKDLDFAYLEINPLVIKDEQIHMLDMVARLDDTALYKNHSLWSEAGALEFPIPFGSSQNQAEETIRQLDSKSGASLKLTILNPNGRIWMLTSGGGGSVIFADTVGDLGSSSELANYGEYSGNPTTDETEVYAEVVIHEMLKSEAKNKVLIIGGGIANFTDVKKTFVGLIKAIRANATKMKAQKIKLFVRRGGPNYIEGLRLIEREVIALGLPIEVYGPETYMTEVVRLALK